jgi:hypothetical protein
MQNSNYILDRKEPELNSLNKLNYSCIVPQYQISSKSGEYFQRWNMWTDRYTLRLWDASLSYALGKEINMAVELSSDFMFNLSVLSPWGWIVWMTDIVVK